MEYIQNMGVDNFVQIYTDNAFNMQNTSNILRVVRSDVFWDSYANFIHMVEAFLVALRKFEKKSPIYGKT